MLEIGKGGREIGARDRGGRAIGARDREGREGKRQDS